MSLNGLIDNLFLCGETISGHTEVTCFMFFNGFDYYSSMCAETVSGNTDVTYYEGCSK